MRPINIVIIVITVIESLRAFDIVYVINRGTNGLELISALVIQNLVGEGQVIGVGSALAVVLLVISLVPITFYLSRAFGRGQEHEHHHVSPCRGGIGTLAAAQRPVPAAGAGGPPRTTTAPTSS